MHALLRDWLIQQGLAESWANTVTLAVAALALLILALVADLITRRILLSSVMRFALRSQAKWDDVFTQRKVFRHLAHFAPAIVVQLLAPVAFPDHPTTVSVLRDGAMIYMLAVGLMTFFALMDAALDLFKGAAQEHRVPLRTLLQAVKVVVFLVGAIMLMSIMLNRSPLVFLSGLGALTAVLLLVFKDTILGFVAGIQLSANDMVREGDWIEMSRYGADGDVIDVALTTVKVRNWDKTITTIPTYALISDSFRNWRGMEESGGRRIKRSVHIDMSSVHICDDAMIERFRKFQHISKYIDGKLEELARYNTEQGVDDSALINGRRMTNLGTFRAYLVEYLRRHPLLHQDMTLLVRQRPPTPQGLPMEIYVFSKDQRWVQYEDIQSDIFDHVLAVVPEFGLRVFQEPSGQDLQSALRTKANS